MVKLAAAQLSSLSLSPLLVFETHVSHSTEENVYFFQMLRINPVTGDGLTPQHKHTHKSMHSHCHTLTLTINFLFYLFF